MIKFPGSHDDLQNVLGNEPGNLPLLQFTLTRLWERQSEGQLTHAAYEEIGKGADKSETAD